MKSLRLAVLEAYGGVIRAVRPNSGLSRLSFNPVVDRLFAGVGGTLEARTAAGVRIEIEPHEYHGRILWLTGSNDWKVTRTVNALLRSGDVLLDIGANLGSIGFAALERVGQRGEVHFFDPQTVIADRLEVAIARAKLDRVTVHRVALSDADGEVTLTGRANHRGVATIMPVEHSKYGGGWSEVVPMRDTAGYLRAFLGDRPFGVKLDVEGAEPRVLPGLFEIPGLRFVIFEGAGNKRWLWDFFTTRKFAVFGLARTLLRPRVVPVMTFEDWNSFHDFVAVPAGPGLPSTAVSPQDLAASLTR